MQKDNMPERQGEVLLEKKIFIRVSNAKEETVVLIQSVIVGILRIADTSRITHVKWVRIVRSFTRQRRNDPPVQEKKEG